MLFDNVILIGFDDEATGVTREGEFVTHDGKPVPAGCEYIRHEEDGLGPEWFEVEILDDGFAEWVEAERA